MSPGVEVTDNDAEFVLENCDRDQDGVCSGARVPRPTHLPHPTRTLPPPCAQPTHTPPAPYPHPTHTSPTPYAHPKHTLRTPYAVDLA